MIDVIAYLIIGIVVLAVVAVIWGMAKIGWDAQKTQTEAKEFFERENRAARDRESSPQEEP